MFFLKFCSVFVAIFQILFHVRTSYDILGKHIPSLYKRKDAERWRKSRPWTICGWHKRCSILEEYNSAILQSASRQLAPPFSLTPRYLSVTQPHYALQANSCNKKSTWLNPCVAHAFIPLPCWLESPWEVSYWQQPIHWKPIFPSSIRPFNHRVRAIVVSRPTLTLALRP